MRPGYPSPRGNVPFESTVLRGTEREALINRMRVVCTSPDGEVLLEDDLGQPWVDRASTDLDPDLVAIPANVERELARVSWREVCLNWPDAVNREERRAG
ncbi:MAG TPA: hypothetical protein VNT60_02840 [Deinococcales bacterium]|nr:hypothetical protein [Deinococcales bacterium]